MSRRPYINIVQKIEAQANISTMALYDIYPYQEHMDPKTPFTVESAEWIIKSNFWWNKLGTKVIAFPISLALLGFLIMELQADSLDRMAIVAGFWAVPRFFIFLGLFQLTLWLIRWLDYIFLARIKSRGTALENIFLNWAALRYDISILRRNFYPVKDGQKISVSQHSTYSLSFTLKAEWLQTGCLLIIPKTEQEYPAKQF